MAASAAVPVVVPVENRRAFDKDYGEDHDKDSASRVPSRCALRKRLSEAAKASVFRRQVDPAVRGGHAVEDRLTGD